MGENRIELHFDKSDSRIGGFPHGQEVYNEQVKNRIDFSRKNIIVFPKEIVKVASSFTQGFFLEIVKQIGYEGIDNIIEIEAANEKLVEDIKADLIN